MPTTCSTISYSIGKLFTDHKDVEHYLGTVFIHFRGLAIVQPGIVKHELDVVDAFPWICIFA